MASNFNQPAITDTYANYTAEIVGNLQDLAKGLDPATCSVSNPPTSAIRYNSSVKYWEKYNGTAWANNEPAGGYAINISGNAATATTASAAPWSGVSGKPTTLSGYGVSSGDTLFDSKYAAKGVYTSSGLTFAATARLLGRSTAGAGAGEEISIGSGLSLSSGVLSCTVSAPVSSVVGKTGAVTAGQILTGLTAVDGAGSGLDADLLDGYHASAFALAGNVVSVDAGTFGIGTTMWGCPATNATHNVGTTYAASAIKAMSPSGDVSSPPSGSVVPGSLFTAGTWRCLISSSYSGGIFTHGYYQRIA